MKGFAMKISSFGILWILIWILSICEGSQLNLDSSNKFQDMLVYINDDILEGDGSLLRNIKEYINSASMSLLKATSNMKKMKAGVQFGTVYIRIPKTWTTAANDSTWQQCNMANFFITTQRDNNNSTEPYTKQLGDCGEPANFTRFSESFFNSKDEMDMMKAGKKIMNEFVKLRYGVFSEKPYKRILNVFNGNKFINSNCGPDIKWTVAKDSYKWALKQPYPVCSVPNKICRYELERDQNQNYSVMFDTEGPEREYFCNDDNKLHNKWAQTLHNMKCNRRSVSSVILQHPDFSPDKDTLQFSGAKFVIIKGQERKIALVLDISSSMIDIIGNMREACVSFVKNVLEESARVGLASFSSSATIEMYAQKMNATNRQTLIQKINGLLASGYTNIPDGLAKGVQILGGDIKTDEKVFGTIILLSDGENNRDGNLYDTYINQVIKKGISVNTISYGNAADAGLNRLARESGGQFLFADPKIPYLDLMNKFSAKKFCEQDNQQIKMIEEKITIEISGSVTEVKLTYLDQYIGINVQITITITQDISRYNISLVSPSSKIILHTDRVNQTSGTTLTFVIPGKAEIGEYKILTKSPAAFRLKRAVETLSVTSTVSATPVANFSRIINPTGELSSSDIETLTDTSFIKATIDLTTCSVSAKEIASVKLTMINPLNIEKVFTMTDDGLGDDNIADDKIFTKTLIAKELNGLGFYGFSANIEISNSESKDVIKRSVELGSVRVKMLSKNPITDKVPPAKIENVNVTIISLGEINVAIITTGDDGMVGNISDYEVMIKSRGGEMIIKRNVKLPPGMRAELQLTVSSANVTNPFEISVRGVDDAKNLGEWSLSRASNWNYDAITNDFVQKFKDGNEASNSALPNVFFVLSASLLITLLR